MNRSLALALTAALLAACGGGSNTSSGSSGSTAGTNAGTTGHSSTSGSGSGGTSSTTGTNHAPLPQDDAATTVTGQAVTIPVLENDTDPDGDTLSIASVSTPLHGNAVVAGPAIIYTPNAGFVGEEDFHYTVSDGRGGTASAIVTVTVDAPPSAHDDTATTAIGVAVTINVLANDTDPDNDPLTVSAAGPATHGQVITNGTTVTYTPDNGFSGTDSFPYSITDGRGGHSSANVTVTVGAPVQLVDDDAGTSQNAAIDIDVLANDSAPSGNTLSLQTVSSALHGLTAIASGEVHYIPNNGFAGDDSFIYSAGDGLSSASAHVHVSVFGPPVAVDDAASTTDGASVLIDVLANDTHPNNLALTVSAVGTPSHGTTTISGNKVLYTPTLGYLGIDSFSYTAQDPRSLTATANVSVLVRAAANGAQLVSGGNHSCVIRPDHTLWCWGDPGQGELGIGNSNVRFQATPVQVGGSTDWQDISAGNSATCGIRGTSDGGTLFCWGEGSQGQLGTGQESSTQSPTQVGTNTNWRQVAMDDEHACGVQTDGTLWCWGNNDNDELGNVSGVGTFGNADSPTQSGSDTDWVQVAVGENHSCAVKTSGALYCWGRELDGQLGVPNPNFNLSTPDPQHVGPPDDWAEVAAAGYCTCGLRLDASLYCWGDSCGGDAPSQVSGGPWVGVQMDGYKPQICAVKADRSLWCWGDNGFGELGAASPPSSTSPVRVGADNDWVTGAPGDSHTCAMQADAGVQCWGRRQYGQLGDGVAPVANSPEAVGPSSGWTAVVAASNATTCGTHAGDLWCWGAPGLLANGNSSFNAPPVQTPTLSESGVPIVRFSSGTSHILALEDGGLLDAWGDGSDGQLGDGTTNSETTPTRTISNITFREVSAGFYNSTGVTSTGALLAWGREIPVDAGAGVYDIPTPTPVDNNTYLSASIGEYGLIAVRSPGTLWSFTYSSPTGTQDGTDANWANIRGDPYTALGLKTDGSLYQVVNGSAPTRVGTASNWIAYDVTGSHQCGIRGSNGQGALYCWGDNTYGELGDGTNTSQSVPEQIGSFTDWVAVSVGSDFFEGSHTCGIRAGGLLYCWGSNSSGEVGDGNAWTTAPQQVLLP
ncbi:MAG: tandem-95 repeat protein [Deltaproteobacteria bacterium]|nr:tandem-95 repeat protein [Deltaproteobacteria bacterium]